MSKASGGGGALPPPNSTVAPMPAGHWGTGWSAQRSRNRQSVPMAGDASATAGPAVLGVVVAVLVVASAVVVGAVVGVAPGPPDVG